MFAVDERIELELQISNDGLNVIHGVVSVLFLFRKVPPSCLCCSDEPQP